MQAMDMIVIKKKRIAIAKRQSLEKMNDGINRRSGLWSMIYPSGNNRNQESNNSANNFKLFSFFSSRYSTVKVRNSRLGRIKQAIIFRST